MTNVKVEFDYITVDTDEWIADRMVRDDVLTESLETWLTWRETDDLSAATWRHSSGEHSHYPSGDHVANWARVTFRGLEWDDKYGPFRDETFRSMATYNSGDNMLRDELGAVWFNTAEGTIFVETARGGYGAYVSPVVYRVTCDSDCLEDYTRASAWCVNDHRYDVEDGTSLQPYDGGKSARVGDQARTVGSVDYIACPECRKGLTFGMAVW